MPLQRIWWRLSWSPDLNNRTWKQLKVQNRWLKLRLSTVSAAAGTIQTQSKANGWVWGKEAREARLIRNNTETESDQDLSHSVLFTSSKSIWCLCVSKMPSFLHHRGFTNPVFQDVASCHRLKKVKQVSNPNYFPNCFNWSCTQSRFSPPLSRSPADQDF